MSLSGFILRLLAALALVLVTYNPTGYSLFHWLWPWQNEQVPLKLLATLVVLIGWIVFARATIRSIGLLGVFLAAALCATLIWLFVDQGWLDLKNSTTLAWSLVIMVAVILGVGVSWSHFRRRLTGQLDTDDVDE
jgi:hypothetical protein